MTSRSMVDIAYEVLREENRELSFIEIWNKVVEVLGFSSTQAENKIAQFYSALMLDVRFASLKDNVWDLRSRRTYNEVHQDTSSLLIEDDSDEEDDEYALADLDDEEQVKDEEEE